MTSNWQHSPSGLVCPLISVRSLDHQHSLRQQPDIQMTFCSKQQAWLQTMDLPCGHVLPHPPLTSSWPQPWWHSSYQTVPHQFISLHRTRTTRPCVLSHLSILLFFLSLHHTFAHYCGIAHGCLFIFHCLRITYTKYGMLKSMNPIPSPRISPLSKISLFPPQFYLPLKIKS